jgi:hypothetical protein
LSEGRNGQQTFLKGGSRFAQEFRSDVAQSGVQSGENASLPKVLKDKQATCRLGAFKPAEVTASRSVPPARGGFPMPQSTLKNSG